MKTKIVIVVFLLVTHICYASSPNTSSNIASCQSKLQRLAKVSAEAAGMGSYVDTLNQFQVVRQKMIEDGKVIEVVEATLISKNPDSNFSGAGAMAEVYVSYNQCIILKFEIETNLLYQSELL